MEDQGTPTAAGAAPGAPAPGAASPQPGAASPPAKKSDGSAAQGCFSTLGIVAGLAVVVGLVMVLCTNSTRVGLYLLVFALPVGVVGLLVAAFDTKRRRRGVIVGAVLLVVAWLSLTAGLAGLTGQIVRWADPADFYGRYGTVVTATMPEQCSNVETTRGVGGAPAAGADYVCDGSSWQLRGGAHTGTIVLGWGDVDNGDRGVGVPDSAKAYVIGDKGYSVKRVGAVDPVVVWEKVPAWFMLGLPVLLVALYGMTLLRWTKPGIDTP